MKSYYIKELNASRTNQSDFLSVEVCRWYAILVDLGEKKE